MFIRNYSEETKNLILTLYMRIALVNSKEKKIQWQDQKLGEMKLR